MSTKTELLALLAQKEGRYASGQELADTLGVSRNAIWKAVKALQEQGYAIESLLIFPCRSLSFLRNRLPDAADWGAASTPRQARAST